MSTLIKVVTGPSGSGKSFKLKKEMSTNNLRLTASTGIASVNLSETACTIHSLLGAIDSEKLLKSFVSNKLNKRLNNLFEDYNGIAIDEFGMLPRDYLDTLIYILDDYSSKTKRDLELYLTGDIAQLPPVTGEPYFKSKYKNRFNTEILTVIHRQTDIRFQEALNDLRLGKTQKIKSLLIENNAFTNEIQSNFLGITLFSTKAKVEAYNLARLNAIVNYTEFSYKGYKTGKVDNSWNSFLEPVVLKVGVLVRCITNTVTDQGLMANGDMGIVEELYKDSVLISLLRNNKSILVKFIKKKILNPDTMLEEGTINYMPLRLSFACTIHSTQGITTDALQISMGKQDTFMGRTSGMAYVGLSRNTNIENIRVIGHPDDFEKCCFIDPEYLKFITSNGKSN